MHRLAIATVIAKNYLPFARVWADSIRRHHPGIPLYVLLADEPENYFAPESEPFHMVRLADLSIPRLRSFLFRNQRQEVVVASKPYVLSHVLDLGFQTAIFLDTDILVLSPLEDVFTEVSHHALTLTPHVLNPMAGADGIERELNILQAGVFNGGFVGVSNTPAARRFLGWWQERHFDNCRHALGEGMHYDQRWLDFAPSFVEDLHVLRDPACNVAYWNLHERDPRMEEGRVLIGGRSCAFFHFSGFDPTQLSVVTKYRPQVTMDSIGPIAKLFDLYAGLLAGAGFSETMHWPYAYGHFENLTPIPDIARQLYRELGDEASRFGDPFSDQGTQSYLAWLNEPVDDAPQTMSRFWQAVYDRRADVREAYPDAAGAGRENFLGWARGQGMTEYGLAACFLPRGADRPVDPV